MWKSKACFRGGKRENVQVRSEKGWWSKGRTPVLALTQHHDVPQLGSDPTAMPPLHQTLPCPPVVEPLLNEVCKLVVLQTEKEAPRENPQADSEGRISLCHNCEGPELEMLGNEVCGRR